MDRSDHLICLPGAGRPRAPHTVRPIDPEFLAGECLETGSGPSSLAGRPKPTCRATPAASGLHRRDDRRRSDVTVPTGALPGTRPPEGIPAPFRTPASPDKRLRFPARAAGPCNGPPPRGAVPKNLSVRRLSRSGTSALRPRYRSGFRPPPRAVPLGARSGRPSNRGAVCELAAITPTRRYVQGHVPRPDRSRQSRNRCDGQIPV